MFRQFAAIAAISEATRQALADHTGRDPRSLSVVLNGVDERQFGSIAKRAAEVSLADPKILTVGSLTTVKDQATAIRAVALLENGRISIVGEGPQRGALEALAAELGVRERVQFLGIRLDIPQLIAAADIYVQTSRWEGFCLAVVEALAGGLPCVASRVAGLQEVIGPAALFFEAGNARELAACLRTLCDSQEQRSALAALGIERARKFSLSACAVGYENLYKAVTAEV
jgi:glycosyltransferase involved in cell wall biosynthesis